MTKKKIEQLDREYTDKLRECHTGDVESDHAAADRLLCVLLELCGMHSSVYEFKRIEKWYA